MDNFNFEEQLILDGWEMDKNGTFCKEDGEFFITLSFAEMEGFYQRMLLSVELGESCESVNKLFIEPKTRRQYNALIIHVLHRCKSFLSLVLSDYEELND